MSRILVIVASVAAALLAGGLAGYRAGAAVRGSARAFWALNVAAVLGCAALDLIALLAGQTAAAYAALGLMGGSVTGIKYGYTDSLRAWPDPERGTVQDQPEAEPAAGSAPGSDEIEESAG